VQIKNILVPDLGGLSGLEIIDIFVAVGDNIQKGEPIVLVETEKASMEIVSDFQGKIIKLYVNKGLKISTGVLLADIEIVDANNIPVQDSLKDRVDIKNSSDAPEEKKIESINQKNDNKKDYLKTGFHAGPAVRKLARELGIDLNQVLPTGLKGRVTLDDVKKFARDRHSGQPSVQNRSQKPRLPDFSQWGVVEEKTLSNIKIKTAENMSRNWTLIPHVTHFDEADITSLEQFRTYQQSLMKDSGIKISPLIFIMKAIAQALKDYPQFNASLSECESKLIYKKYINLGVAVETADGLVVPVIKDVDKKSIKELAQELKTISAQARDKKLSLSAMTGQSFTVSSLGGIGGTGFTPIVNWPDVAILGVSKVQKKIKLDKGQVTEALILPFSLSYDHRVIDGAEAARFCVQIVRYLEDIRTLLL
jgi:pyruvate dehydrogenase E2 component (dihydrolipoamide acetyltransferase)